MSFWVLAQVLLQILTFAGLGVLWVKLSRPAKDDPRLSKGLQLLQSKIAVLEDLSDRTEVQVSQLTTILEHKCRDLQEKIAAADKQIAKIEQSGQKSLEIAQIFQDRIPHDEIIERQKTIKYVRAAQLAHQGCSVAEIAAQVDLTLAEIEMIAKVNRDQLQFSPEDLPQWAQGTRQHTKGSSSTTLQNHLPRAENQVVAPPSGGGAAIAPIPQTLETAPPPSSKALRPSPGFSKTEGAALPQTFIEIDLNRPQPAAMIRTKNTRGEPVEIKPFQFPRVEV